MQPGTVSVPGLLFRARGCPETRRQVLSNAVAHGYGPCLPSVNVSRWAAALRQPPPAGLPHIRCAP